MRFFLTLFFLSVFHHSSLLKANNLELITYNTGLALGYIPYTKERLEPMGRMIHNEAADVVCLQEVWSKEDQDYLIEKLKDQYPYSFAGKIQQKTSEEAPACSLTNLIGGGKLGNCLMSHCLGKKGNYFSACITHTCQKSLQKLKEENSLCLEALLGKVGVPLWKVIASVLNPFQKSELFTYKGSPGLVILSKLPFMHQEEEDMSNFSTTIHRSSLYVEIEYESKPLHLLCTHLTSELKSVPYVGSFKGWSGENLHQVDYLSQWFVQKMKGDAGVWMGDFNSGPKIKEREIEGELEASYQLLANRNFYDPFLYEKNASCSFCRRNSLQPKDEEVNDTLIDHLLTYNFAGKLSVVKTRIVFDQPLPVSVSTKKTELHHLSDHFGLKLSLKKGASL